MARHKKRRASHKRARHSGGRKMGGKNGPFAKAARKCWVQLRAGELPRKGDFKKCMKKEL